MLVACLGGYWSSPVDRSTPARWTQVALMALIALAVASGRRRPGSAGAVAGAATAVGVIAGWSTEPFLVTAWILHRVALRRAGPLSRRVAVAVVVVLGVTAVGAGGPVPAVAVRTMATGVVVLAVSWLLGGAIRRAVSDAAAAAGAEQERVVAAERLRLAREVHDVVSHSLGAITLIAGVARHRAEGGGDARAGDPAVLAEIEQLGREALAELQGALSALRDPSLPGRTAPLPGLGDLDGLITTARSAGTPAGLELRTGPELSAPQQAAVHQVVREGLANAARHATGAACTVVVDTSGDVVEVLVDNGPPPEGHQVAPVPGGGHGLIGLGERIGALGGDLVAGPRPDGGYRLAARFPVAAVGDAAGDAVVEA